MAKWKIELKNVGPERANGTMTVEAQNLIEAKTHAMRECRRYLPSGNIYLEAQGQYRYLVIDDMDEAGEVQLTRLDIHAGKRLQRQRTEESESLR